MKFKISCLCIAIASMIASAEPAKTTKFGDIKLDTDVNVELISKGTIDGEKIITSKDLLLYEPDTEKINALETKVNAVETKSTKLNTKVDGFDQRITDAETKATNAETKANKVDELETKVNTLDDTVNNKLDTIISDKVGDIVVSDEAINKAVGNKMNSFQRDIDKINDKINTPIEDKRQKYKIQLMPIGNKNVDKIRNYDIFDTIFEMSSNENLLEFKPVISFYYGKWGEQAPNIKTITIVNDDNNSIYSISTNKIILTGIPGSFTLKAITSNEKIAITKFNIKHQAHLIDLVYKERDTSYRYMAQTNMLEHFKKIDINNRETFPCLNNKKDYPRQLRLYGDNGTYVNERETAIVNTNFFWPELADNLRFCSIARSDVTGWANIMFEKHMVSPHYYITAVHCYWPYSTHQQYCVDRKNNKFIQMGWGGPGPNDLLAISDDLGIGKYNVGEFPSNKVMKFCSEELFKELSFTKFNKSLCMHLTSHNLIAPAIFNASGSSFLDFLNTKLNWMSDSDKAILNSCYHPLHSGDSSRLTFIVMPNNKVIPTQFFTTGAGVGPNLIDNKTIKWIKDFVEKDSNGKETIQMWTKEELIK